MRILINTRIPFEHENRIRDIIEFHDSVLRSIFERWTLVFCLQFVISTLFRIDWDVGEKVITIIGNGSLPALELISFHLLATNPSGCARS